MKLRRHCGFNCPQTLRQLACSSSTTIRFQADQSKTDLRSAWRAAPPIGQHYGACVQKMSAGEQCVKSLDDLRVLVTKTLCDHEGLEPGAFRLFERILHRRGRPCGIQYCLAGPRSVRLTAYWEAAKRTVLFYDSTGERFARVELTGTSVELLADEQAA